MTPGARAAAAIAILDQVLAGEAAERALTRWARASRFAGSGDRAAVRDLVFDALRCRRSFLAASGQAEETARALVLGGLMAQAGPSEGGVAGAMDDAPEAPSAGPPDGPPVAVAAVFSGAGHAPPPLSEAELAALVAAPPPGAWPKAICHDIPDWLEPALRESLGDDFATVLTILRQRAPVDLRVNQARATPAAAIAALAAEGVEAAPGPLSPTALRLGRGAGRLRGTRAYAEGLVELQDAASQAVVDALPLAGHGRILDYCAGGGGKVLAMAARHPDATYHAHDADPRRMADLPVRAARAGVSVRLLDTASLGGLAPFDLVLLDVPCSGSGSWRRAPEAKWRLTPERLAELGRLQAEILRAGARLVAPRGVLAYVTCSLLAAENQAQLCAFRADHPEWRIITERRFTPADGGDGFYLAVLTRAPD